VLEPSAKTSRGDKGYQGCDLVTPRKTPVGGEFSKGDKANNAVISKLRAPPRDSPHISSRGVLKSLTCGDAHSVDLLFNSGSVVSIYH
jgi:hypothetical protein